MPHAPIPLPNRGFLRISGPDKHFLQGIISQDIEWLQTQPSIYACLLTPQGKFLHDFFVINLGDDWLIDGEADRINDLQTRLLQFRLRHKVEILDETQNWQVTAVIPAKAESRVPGSGSLENFTTHGASRDGWPEMIVIDDPRHAQMGQRIYQPADAAAVFHPAAYAAYEMQRIRRCIPDGARDMEIEKALPMEFRLNTLNGISLKKGCFLGQEMCSRMFFRDLLKRQTYPLQFYGDAPPAGTPIIDMDGQMAGEVRSSIGNLAIGMVKIDAAQAALTAGGLALTVQTALDLSSN